MTTLSFSGHQARCGKRVQRQSRRKSVIANAICDNPAKSVQHMHTLSCLSKCSAPPLLHQVYILVAHTASQIIVCVPPPTLMSRSATRVSTRCMSRRSIRTAPFVIARHPCPLGIATPRVAATPAEAARSEQACAFEALENPSARSFDADHDCDGELEGERGNEELCGSSVRRLVAKGERQGAAHGFHEIRGLCSAHRCYNLAEAAMDV